jgi:hypothetical protein
VRQQARLRVRDESSASRSRTRNRDLVTVGARVVGHLPPLSLGASLHPPTAVPTSLGQGYDAVLVELTDRHERWPALLAAAAEQAASLNAGLDVRLVTADPQAIARGVNLLQGLPVHRLGAFDPIGHLTTHHQALRALANRLVGILHGCLTHHTHYQEATAWPSQRQLAA